MSVSRYLNAYENVQRARKLVKGPDFYNKSPIEELDAINEFNAAKEELFQELCANADVKYLFIVDTKEYRRT